MISPLENIIYTKLVWLYLHVMTPTFSEQPRLNILSAWKSALGSKKTHSARIKRLKELGFSDKLLNKISGPIGLDIKAKTPEEIAISIVAEIILYSNGQSIHEV